MLTQKTVKTKSSVIIKNAEKIKDKKTRRTFKKMFKQTTRRKQRLLEKREAERMVKEFEQEKWEEERYVIH